MIWSRIEGANKQAGTRLLISDALLRHVEGKIEVTETLRTRLPGTEGRATLHEVRALTSEGVATLDMPGDRDTAFFAGRRWTRMLGEDGLADGEHRVVKLEDRDIVILKDMGAFFAFNNACPHLHIPLFETRPEIPEGDIGYYPGTDRPRPPCSAVTEDRGLICRWRNSCFDLQTGEVRDWAPRLEDGMSPGWEFIGDMSRNASPLVVFPCHARDGAVWVALEKR